MAADYLNDDRVDASDIIEEIVALEADDSRDADDNARLEMLNAIAVEGMDLFPDWEYGEVLVRDSDFQNYAQELAEDCGMIPDGLEWPLSCIDWAQAAWELRHDYSSIEIDGVTYWGRA